MTRKIRQEVNKRKLEVLREAADILMSLGYVLQGDVLRDTIPTIKEELEQKND